jgi:hypothetical protein
METIIHNQTDINFHDVQRSAQYFFEGKVNKFSKTSDGAIHIWVEPSLKSSEGIKCGVHLIRPNEKNLYIHKDGYTLKDAMMMSAKALFQSLNDSNKERQ